MPSYRKILVIYNPQAGTIKLTNIPRRIESRLQKERVDYTMRATTAGGDALKWARTAHAEGFDLVVAIGGDGTIREVVEGLMRSGSQLPLAMIPAGTGNVTALSLSVPIDPRRAIDLIFDGREERFDVGYLPELDRYFMFVVGTGYDAMLIRDTPQKQKRRFGFMAYIGSGIKNFFKFRPVDVVLELDGKVEKMKAHTIMAINIGGIYKIDWAIAPNIHPRDGKLNIMVMSTRSMWGSLLVILKLLVKSYHGYSHLRHFEASRIRVDADPPLPVQVDGEAMGTTPVLAHVIPSGISIVVPVDYL